VPIKVLKVLIEAGNNRKLASLKMKNYEKRKKLALSIVNFP